MQKQLDLSLRLFGIKVILPVISVTILSVILPLFIHYHLSEGWGRLILSTVVSCLVVSALIYTIGLNAIERNFIMTGFISRVKRIFYHIH